MNHYQFFQFLYQIILGNFKWVSDDFRLMFVRDLPYDINFLENTSNMSGIINFEIRDTGYLVGGYPLLDKSSYKHYSNLYLTASSITSTRISGSFDGIVLYNYTHDYPIIYHRFTERQYSLSNSVIISYYDTRVIRVY